MKTSQTYKKIRIFTDGGSRGNPGPSGIGVFIADENNKRIYGLGRYIGHATNNIAEYTAVLEAHIWLQQNLQLLDPQGVVFFHLDSELVYSQLKGVYKIKNPVLKELLFKIQYIQASLPFQVEYSHIPREQNKEADRLVNEALDNPPLVTYN